MHQIHFKLRSVKKKLGKEKKKNLGCPADDNGSAANFWIV